MQRWPRTFQGRSMQIRGGWGYCILCPLLSYIPYSIIRREHKSFEFEMHEAYAIDIIVSTGEGKVGVWFGKGSTMVLCSLLHTWYRVFFCGCADSAA